MSNTLAHVDREFWKDLTDEEMLELDKVLEADEEVRERALSLISRKSTMKETIYHFKIHKHGTRSNAFNARYFGSQWSDRL